MRGSIVADVDRGVTDEISVDLPFTPEPGKAFVSHIFHLDPFTGELKRESRGDSQWPFQVTYRLYDSRQVWWLVRDEYERHTKEAESQTRYVDDHFCKWNNPWTGSITARLPVSVQIVIL
ncbi:MAG: hypothetical protein HY232_00505 [Acidobacteria bacterium]|nr:hypothetical protein [Acidobacteriota bacterium]